MPISTLHLYERQGLIHSPRTSGNQRRNFRAVLRWVAIIKVVQHRHWRRTDCDAHSLANKSPVRAE